MPCAPTRPPVAGCALPVVCGTLHVARSTLSVASHLLHHICCTRGAERRLRRLRQLQVAARRTLVHGACCTLQAFGCTLHVTCCKPSVARYMLQAFGCTLHVTCQVLHDGRCTLQVVRCMLQEMEVEPLGLPRGPQTYSPSEFTDPSWFEQVNSVRRHARNVLTGPCRRPFAVGPMPTRRWFGQILSKLRSSSKPVLYIGPSASRCSYLPRAWSAQSDRRLHVASCHSRCVLGVCVCV